MKNLIIGLAVLAILGGGAWYAFSTGLFGEPAAPVGSAAPQTELTAEGTVDGGLYDLLGLSGSYECTVGGEALSVGSSGKVLVSGGKVRADFTSDAPVVGVVSTSLIADAEYVYAWSSLAPNGYRARRASVPANGSAQLSGGTFDPNQRYRYSCKEATIPANAFALPKEITFVDAPGV